MRLAVMLLVVTACERADKTVARTKQVLIANPQPVVTLIDPGREPRVVQRLRPTKRADTYEIRVATTYDWDTGQREVQPVLTMKQRREVVEVRDDQAFRERWTMQDIVYDPPTDHPMLVRYAWLEGSVIEQWGDTRGMLLGDSRVTLDERLQPDDYETDTTAYTMVLPEEPIGAGARWQIEARGVMANAKITAELIAVAADSLDIKTQFEHTTNRFGSYRGTGTSEIHLVPRGPGTRIDHVERGTGTIDGHTVRYSIETAMKVTP